MTNFHPFERSQSLSARVPWETIHKDGANFFVNREALQLLDNPLAVELSFDPEAKLIGIRAGEPTGRKSYLLRSANNGARKITGIAFTRYWQIDTSVSRRYKVYMDGAYLILDLKTTCIEFAKSRSKLREKYKKRNQLNVANQN